MEVSTFFWRFIDHGPQPEVLTQSHNHMLVILSVVIACVSSFSALQAIVRVRATPHKFAKNVWLLVGAFIAGLGIWAMHFTGMLAHTLAIPVQFNVGITVISMFPAILGTYCGLRYLVLNQIKYRAVYKAALCFALGIGSMHYLGMEAIVTNARLAYNPYIFILSILIAYILALAASYTIVGNFKQRTLKKVFGSSLLMGLDVSCMHYTAMFASKFFVPLNSSQKFEAQLPAHQLAIWVACIVVVIIVFIMISAIIDQKMIDLQQFSLDILEAAPGGIITTTAEGKIETANFAAHQMFPKNTMVIGHDIRDYLGDINLEKLNSENLIHLAKLNGGSKVVQVIVGGSKAGVGERLIVILRDVTNEKKMEYEREQERAMLFQASKLASLGEMAGGIAHEINNPITVIKMRADQAIRLLELSPANTNKAIDFLKVIHKTSIQISSIVNGLREVTRSDQADNYELINIDKIIMDALSLCSDKLKQANICVETNFQEGATIFCHPNQIIQVVLNMISNAKQSLIQSKIDTPKIVIDSYHERQSAVIRISDNGNGISQENVTKIMEPFFTTKEVGKGVGIGLSISSKIIESHGGTIVLSNLRPATFEIFIPLKDENSLLKSG